MSRESFKHKLILPLIACLTFYCLYSYCSPCSFNFLLHIMPSIKFMLQCARGAPHPELFSDYNSRPCALFIDGRLPCKHICHIRQTTRLPFFSVSAFLSHFCFCHADLLLSLTKALFLRSLYHISVAQLVRCACRKY